MALQGKLSHPKRFITTHDDQGRAIVDSSIPAEAPFYELPDKVAAFAQCYVTRGFPTQISHGADIEVYQKYLRDSPGLTVSDGTVLRYVDMPPGQLSPMHRTVSLDYGVVLEGEVELVLDSGETRVLKRGDVCIQRATMHAWRNISQTEWARMLYILQPVQPLTIGRAEIREDLGHMAGVKESS
ncbi:Cupin domain-containing protein [Pleurostoma richardsiae]|uniref:Cupin domain-containing protein n=1 Tax=Pleurostoma richardsiae TaxID=41990 RepID=A0AA38RCL5_9PEZI|nr:Cupin domain-containing protein [Pleurostoma richardsiae]